jgi:hypothetical protein
MHQPLPADGDLGQNWNTAGTIPARASLAQNAVKETVDGHGHWFFNLQVHPWGPGILPSEEVYKSVLAN